MTGSNQLYYGDNLDVLREHVADDSVDLIYLDPPFNSNANYNILFRSPRGVASDSQIEAFEDTWHYGEEAEQAFCQVMASGNTDVANLLRAMQGFLGRNDMMAYLTMMAVRLIELHRVLKPAGSLYLHCDPTASHYLKLLLDGVFGVDNYLNEIIWRRTGSHNNARRFGPVHDVIHFYRKSDAYRHRPVFRPYANGHVDGYFRKSDARGRYWTNSIHGAGVRNGESGRPWRGYDPTAMKRHWAVPSDLVTAFGIDPDLAQHLKLDALADLGLIDFPPQQGGALPTYRQYLDRSPGLLLQDVWAYQPHTRGTLHGSAEGIDEDVRWLAAQGDGQRLGYPTQKPLGLLERIVAASSGPDDVVLDPFCGCGTAVHAAQRLGRRWIGIDVTYLAVGLIERRLREAFSDIAFEVIGEPKGLMDAQHLAASEPYQFQYWITQKIGGQPYQGGRKGPDRGIDGYIFYTRNAVGAGKTTTAAAIISVKAGRTVGVAMIRELKGVLDREDADIGIFVCVAAPTREMQREAVAAGYWTDPVSGVAYRRVQIFTLADLFDGRQPRVPLLDRNAGYRRARTEDRGVQATLF